jgi:predicted nucleic acid-binding protein
MLYLDTTVLLAVLTPEVHTQVATLALGLKVRTGALTNSQADAVLEAYQHTLVPALVMLEIEGRDFRHADACLRSWPSGLRAADALHLAIAVGRGATLSSLDAGLVGAAKGLGLPAQLLTTPA